METLKHKLHQTGLKATRGRLEVLHALQELGGHRSADDILRLLTQQGKTVARGSVFKIVADLCRVNLLMVTDAGPGRTLYELNEVWHHHFVCRDCGTIFDIPCVEGRKPCLMPDVKVPAVIEEAQIIFRGLCLPCSQKAQELSQSSSISEGKSDGLRAKKPS